METVNDILTTLISANPETLVTIVSLGAMFIIYLIIKLFLEFLEKKWSSHE